MGLRVLERNLNFSERKLAGRLWQGKARLDAAFAKSMNQLSLWLHDWIGEKSFCTEQSSISIRLLGQFEVGSKTGFWEIAPESASVYERGRFTWTMNAQPVLLKNSTRSRPQGRNADYSLKWISAAKCAQ
jgi:hypothetical protein